MLLCNDVLSVFLPDHPPLSARKIKRATKCLGNHFREIIWTFPRSVNLTGCWMCKRLLLPKERHHSKWCKLAGLQNIMNPKKILKYNWKECQRKKKWLVCFICYWDLSLHPIKKCTRAREKHEMCCQLLRALLLNDQLCVEAIAELLSWDFFLLLFLIVL